MSKYSSRRTRSHHQAKQQQPIETNDEYDEYIYYPYQPKSNDNGGYEYVPESEQNNQPVDQQYYEEENIPAAPQRTVFRNEIRDDIVASRDHVRVIVRARPLNNRELESNFDPQTFLHCENGKSIVIDKNDRTRPFTFDAVFDEGSTQEEVFHYSGIQYLVEMAINGYTSTCFAYGQTGSGKTHTMIGPGGATIFRMDEQYRTRNYGLAPRAILYLFDRLRTKTQEGASPFYIRVSYCEIYNEQIRDLINPATTESLQVRGSIEDGFYVENLYATYIETIDDLMAILEEGELNRAMASHNLNDTSSRSHALLTIQIEQDFQDQNEDQKQMTRQGKLIFVDLAGSEKLKASLSKGKQLVETNNINKSLLTLGTCISALSDPNKRSGHIPYRESKLTRLLADSLGGHGITLMVACISPAKICESETLSTLRYASRAKFIENDPIIKTDSKENVINRLKREVRKLKDENYQLKQKLGLQTNNQLPRMKQRNSEDGTQTSINSAGSNATYDRQDSQGQFNGVNAQKIRTHHSILARENEKLVRQLHRQTGRNERQVIIREEPVEEEEILPRPVRRVIRAYRPEPDDEIMELVRRPSYVTRYRTTRSRHGDDVSPQRPTRIIRRVANSSAIEARR